MTPTEIGVYVLGLICIVYVVYIMYPREQAIQYVIAEKPVLQSPEYRCSTKCFDCVRQKSQEHWNVSHGNPHMYGAH